MISSSPAWIRHTSELRSSYRAHCLEQIVDRTGRHAVDLRLHLYRDNAWSIRQHGSRTPEERPLRSFHHRPLHVTGVLGPHPAGGRRYGRSRENRCAPNGPRRSVRSSPARSVPAKPAARHHGSDRRHHERGMCRAGQPEGRPAARSPPVRVLAVHTDDLADGPTSPEPHGPAQTSPSPGTKAEPCGDPQFSPLFPQCRHAECMRRTVNETTRADPPEAKIFSPALEGFGKI